MAGSLSEIKGKIISTQENKSYHWCHANGISCKIDQI